MSAPGGSNFVCYALDQNRCTMGTQLQQQGDQAGADRAFLLAREPFGVIKNYHLNTPDRLGLIPDFTINNAMSIMSSNNQRRMVLPVHFRHDAPDEGIAAKSAGGSLPAVYVDNLIRLIQAGASIGIANEVIIKMCPIGDNCPTDWTSFRDDLYLENVLVLMNLKNAVRRALGSYPILWDIAGEGIGPSSVRYAPMANYARKLWQTHFHLFGKDHSFMSIICGSEDDIANRISMMQFCYDGQIPDLFSFHFYNGNGGLSAYNQFMAVDRSLKLYGYRSQGLIVGECYRNDPWTAQPLRQASNESGRTIHFLCQWPINPAKTCGGFTDVAYDFNHYTAEGF